LGFSRVLGLTVCDLTNNNCMKWIKRGVMKKKEGEERYWLDFHASETISDGGVFLHLGFLSTEGVAWQWICVYHLRRYHFRTLSLIFYSLCVVFERTNELEEMEKKRKRRKGDESMSVCLSWSLTTDCPVTAANSQNPRSPTWAGSPLPKLLLFLFFKNNI
jgi:hypothetical protein